MTDFSNALIEIDTKNEKKIPYGMRGVNNETSNKEVFIHHNQCIEEVKKYNRLGFIRWPGGTNTDVFNWRTGMPDIEFGAFAYGPDGRIHGSHTTFKLGEAKGGEQISQYKELLQQTSTKAIITVNTFHHTPEQIADLAKYLHDNHIPVIYFELGNEVMFFTAKSGAKIPYYKTAADYLDRVRSYHNVIKENYPNAQVIISMANSNRADITYRYDPDIINYPDPYWDGITFHRFEGNGTTFEEAMKDGNDALDQILPLIENEYVKKFKDKKTPIYIGEHGVALGGILGATQYHGINVVENVLRLSSHPNITYLAGFRLHDGIFNTTITKNGIDPALLLEDASQRGEMVEPSKLKYESYYQAVSACLNVLGVAILDSMPSADYEGEALIEWPDHITEGQAGVAVHYVDNNNHIRFVYDRGDYHFKLIEVIDGKEQVLDVKEVRRIHQRMYMSLTLDGGNLYCKLNNYGTILRTTQPSQSGGKFALYSTKEGTFFDLVRLYTANTYSYKIYRSLQPYSGFKQIDTGLREPFYSDNGLDPMQVYFYKVTAVNEYGESRGYSNTVRKN